MKIEHSRKKILLAAPYGPSAWRITIGDNSVLKPANKYFHSLESRALVLLTQGKQSGRGSAVLIRGKFIICILSQEALGHNFSSKDT